MIDGLEHADQDEFRGARLRIYEAKTNHPQARRIFVWTKMGWFERIEGSSGNVAFTPVAESETELRDLIAQDDPQFELIELGGDFRKTVSTEFREQSTFDQNFREQAENETGDEDEDQQYHQHD
jgi:hypothetical protein